MAGNKKEQAAWEAICNKNNELLKDVLISTQLKLWTQIQRELLKSLNTLANPQKTIQVYRELDTLVQKLVGFSDRAEKNRAVNQFISNCQNIFDNKSLRVIKKIAVLAGFSLAISATIALISVCIAAAIIGGPFGVLALLIMPVLTAKIGIIIGAISAAIGIGATILVGPGFFNKVKEAPIFKTLSKFEKLFPQDLGIQESSNLAPDLVDINESNNLAQDLKDDDSEAAYSPRFTTALSRRA